MWACHNCIYHEHLNPDAFMDECYKVETCMKVCDHIINPSNGSEQWPETGGTTENIVQPLEFSKPQKGKKETERRKGTDEVEDPHKISKSGATMTCSLCGEGHNKRFHGTQQSLFHSSS